MSLIVKVRCCLYEASKKHCKAKNTQAHGRGGQPTYFGSTTQGWGSAWWASPGADTSSRENGDFQAQGSPKPENGHPKTMT